MKLPCSACFQRSHLKTWITAVIVVQCVVVFLYLDVTKSDGQPKLWGIVSRSVFGGSENDTQTAPPGTGSGIRHSRFQADDDRLLSGRLGRAGRQASGRLGTDNLAASRDITRLREHELAAVESAIRNYTKLNPSFQEKYSDVGSDVGGRSASGQTRDLNKMSVRVSTTNKTNDLISAANLLTSSHKVYNATAQDIYQSKDRRADLHKLKRKTNDIGELTTNLQNEKKIHDDKSALGMLGKSGVVHAALDGQKTGTGDRDVRKFGEMVRRPTTPRDGLVAYLRGELPHKFVNQAAEENQMIPVIEINKMPNPPYEQKKRDEKKLRNESPRMIRNKVLNPPYSQRNITAIPAKNEAVPDKQKSKISDPTYVSKHSDVRVNGLENTRYRSELPNGAGSSSKAAKTGGSDRKEQPYKTFIVHLDNPRVKEPKAGELPSSVNKIHQQSPGLVADVGSLNQNPSHDSHIKNTISKTVDQKAANELLPTSKVPRGHKDKLSLASPREPGDSKQAEHGNIEVSHKSDEKQFTVNSGVLQLSPGEGMENYFTMDGPEPCFVQGTKPREASDTQVPAAGGAGSAPCACKPNWHGRSCSIPDLVYFSSGAGFLDAMKPRNRSRRIINALAFNVEFELLEARFYELDKVVDVFVIFESNYSNFGEPKPLRLLERLQTGFLKEFHHKIVYILRDYFPPGGREDGWLVDEHMRTFIGNEGLKRIGNTRPDDIFLYTDADELPSHDALQFLRLHNGYPEPFGFTLRWSVFGFFWKQMDPTRIWAGCTLGMMRYVFHYSAYDVRAGDYFSKHTNLVQSYIKAGGNVFEWYLGEVDMYAGWHCSWCLSPDRIQIKLTSAINADFPRWGDFPEKRKLDYIRGLIKSGTWFDDIMKFDSLTNRNEDTFYAPQHLLLNYDKYKSLLNLDDA